MTPDGNTKALLGSDIEDFNRALEANRPPPPKPAAGMELTEDGVALAFVDKHANGLRFCHDSGAWYVWKGTHWEQNKTGLAFTWARDLVRELNRDTEFKTRAITGKYSFASAVEGYARRDTRVSTTAEVWDADPFLLGTPGGVVDLRSGKLRKARPGDHITKITGPAPAAPGATCDAWLAFLDQATGRDVGLIRFLQQWCGYCLTGSTREHALLFIYGPGGNGKSVFLNTLAGILGGYNANAAMDTFTDSGVRHLTFLAMLAGARMVTAAETEEGRAWAETKIKEMTGGTPITANYMRRDPFTFTPQFKITITGNHKPALKNVDDAARRRFNIVPFLHTPAQPDRQLEDKLKAEWPAILAWMIEGCLNWQRHGLLRPAVVKDATAEYFEAQDIIGRWIAERCILDPSLAEKPGRLVADCREWAAENGELPPSPQQFRSAIEKVKGVRYATVRGKQEVKGIGFQALNAPFNEGQGGEGGGRWR